MNSISIIILTYNEEIHIERCIESAKKISNQIFIVDSYSTDQTVTIAEKHAVAVYQNPFINQAIQFNWALDNLPITTEWVFRLDADEYLSEELIEEINKKLNSLPVNISGVIIPRNQKFLDRVITRGTGKVKLLRLFRFKKGRSEVRKMDEHIILLEGESIEFDNFFTDHNLKNLSFWIQKHNDYAIREAAELLDAEFGFTNKSNTSFLLTEEARVKRERKIKYSKLPLFWRSFFYFIYRYFFKFGFIEGKEGFLWHFLQGWWYRTLVDAKIWEIKKICNGNKDMIKEYLKKMYDFEM